MNKQPNPILKSLSTILVVAVIAAAFYFSIQVTQPDFVKLIVSAPKAQQILPQLLTPDLFTRDAETGTLDLAFPIPCGSAAPGVPAAAGASLHAEPGCAEARQEFVLTGSGFPRNTDIKLSWVMPDERSFSLLTLGNRAAVTSFSQIEVPEAIGFAVIRAPMRGRAFAADIEATLKRAGCAVRRS